jgi:hypothetical protein
MSARKSGKFQLRSLPFFLFALWFTGFGLPTLMQEVPLWLNPPSAEITRLTIATAMTPEATQLFYRQTPIIESKSAFAQSCSNINHATDELVALGCFRSSTQSGLIISGKIYIQSITDPRFDGIMEVTAAHEMLHAVYVRLSKSEQKDLGDRLERAALRVKDPRLAEVLKRYKDTDRELYRNELHSHLGTELGNLGDEVLEKHYRRYFTDRTKVVALAQKSQTAFRQLDDKAQALKTELDTLEANLKADKQSIKKADQALLDAQQNLDSLKSSLMILKDQADDSSGENFTSLAQRFESTKSNYNTQVQDYNAQVQTHQDQVGIFNQKVDEYKQKVITYNAIGTEERSLLSELSATPNKIKPTP